MLVSVSLSLFMSMHLFLCVCVYMFVSISKLKLIPSTLMLSLESPSSKTICVCTLVTLHKAHNIGHNLFSFYSHASKVEAKHNIESEKRKNKRLFIYMQEEQR